MPRSLRDRCRPDSICEFFAAAQERYVDGMKAAAADRRTAAIYLWGYAAEMTLKAAYFRVIGFHDLQAITLAHLSTAANHGIALQIAWPPQGRLHNVRAWAELLVKTRALTPAAAYASPSFGLEIQRRGRWIEVVWSETLRYHKNIAYPYEVRRIREAAEWLLANASQL
jgi:hypothetical protein